LLITAVKSFITLAPGEENLDKDPTWLD
jgi:hypothetical protein